MIDRLTDAELNVGKILILNQLHGLSISEIKEKTNAKKVSKISPTRGKSDPIIYAFIKRALRAAGRYYWGQPDIYRVDGENASTLMLILADDSYCASVEIDAKNMKKLHGACLTKALIERAREEIDNALSAHKKLTDSLADQKFKSSIGEKSKQLEQIALGYADRELDAAMKKINAVMDTKW